MTIEQNVQDIEQTVREAQAQSAGLSSNDITLICVSKYHTVEETQSVYDTGIRHFGENRPEGLREKQAALPDDIDWHYIGTLQTRKVKEVINDISYFHALDREKLAKEIQKRADHSIKCFVQVNISGEASKHGIAPDEVVDFIQKMADYDKIQIIGLMTMAPIDASLEECRKYFAKLRQLCDTIQATNLSYAPCTELSMGMSRDYSVAIEEGASFVRVGSAFFANEETS